MARLVTFLGVAFLGSVLGQTQYCAEYEELSLNNNGKAYADCTSNSLNDGDYMTYIVEPNWSDVNTVEVDFRVKHFLGAACDNNAALYETASSCAQNTAFCGKFDVEIELSLNDTSKSCIEVECRSTGGCDLLLSVIYTPDNYKPPSPVQCFATVYEAYLAYDAYTVLYCSWSDGLTDKAKLDYFVESVNSDDMFSVYYAENTNSYSGCNMLPQDSRPKTQNGCDSVDECEETNLATTKGVNGVCLMIQCENSLNQDCFLDFGYEFFQDGTYGKQVHCKYSYKDVSLGPWDGQLFFDCSNRDGLSVGDDFEMSVKVAAGGGDDDFRVFHAEGSDCNFQLDKENAIRSSSCVDKTDRCVKSDLVLEKEECVAIECANFINNCNLDIEIEWYSPASVNGPLVVFSLATFVLSILNL